MSLSITRVSRDSLPRIPFRVIAKSIFQKNYHVSLVITTDRGIQKLNQTYRKKHYIPNVLSFPLTQHEGEIFLNLREARREWEQNIVVGSWRAWVALLVIHSLLHLNGMRHGRTMERKLGETMKRYGFSAQLSPHGKKNYHRH